MPISNAPPAAGSAVASAPNEVVLWFTSNIEPAFSTIEVRTMSGVAMQASKAAADPK
ncbi:MAG: copper resistance protein CopC [Pseudolabrys sp.]|nr:copper resistance protein CopC [Pseudolabrys sp.]